MQDPEFQQLSSSRLTIRRFHRADAEALAAYRLDPEVARYQAWDSCSLGEATEFIESLLGLSPGMPGEWFQFAVALAPDGPLIGDCALRCEAQQAELGFTFARCFQGRGYASEAVRCLLGYAFDSLRLDRVFSITDKRNLSARRLLERLGFQLEGAVGDCTWFKGEWVRELRYMLTREDWRIGNEGA